MFVRTKSNGKQSYLVIAENYRENGKRRQRVLHRLGRLDLLQQSGKLDGLMLSMQRFSEKLAVLGAHAKGQTTAGPAVRVGPGLIFDRLWRELGVDAALSRLLEDRRFEFSVERAVFLTTLHRLVSPGSDRAAEKWRDAYRIEGAQRLELQHLYRAMAWLGAPLPADGQDAASPFSPRCNKDLLEEQLFARRRDLFTGLDLVFFDTTSIYFEGEGGGSIGQYGHSKDHRPDLKQMIVGVVLDSDGNPVCSELWPGNTTDVKSLIPVAERLRRRFGVGRVCVVADRGMISAGTIEELEAMNWSFILGARMRSCAEVSDQVLTCGGRYQEVIAKGCSSKDPAPLKVKEVRIPSGDPSGVERRYVVCLNEDEAAKDRRDREAIVASLREALKDGDKSLVGNKGYRRYLAARGERFSVDEEKVKSEERYDGKWVLRTNTDLPAADVALKYKQLWMVEEIFRAMKSLLATRPIFHKRDETIRGHVFCSFLALLLRKKLEDRLVSKGHDLEWADVIRDLDNLVEMEIGVDGKRYVIRSEAKGTVWPVFTSCGAALPPTLRQV